MTSSSFNPSDYPDGKGPRPLELIDDPVEIDHDERQEQLRRATEEMNRLSQLAERDARGLRR